MNVELDDVFTHQGAGDKPIGCMLGGALGQA